MNLKKIGKAFTSKSVETRPSSYKKRICRAAVSQRLRKTGLWHCSGEAIDHPRYSPSLMISVHLDCT